MLDFADRNHEWILRLLATKQNQDQGTSNSACPAPAATIVEVPCAGSTKDPLRFSPGSQTNMLYAVLRESDNILFVEPVGSALKFTTRCLRTRSEPLLKKNLLMSSAWGNATLLRSGFNSAHLHTLCRQSSLEDYRSHKISFHCKRKTSSLPAIWYTLYVEKHWLDELLANTELAL